MSVSEAAASGSAKARQPHLKGHLGVGGLLLTALAFNGPLGTMVGFVPVVIGTGLGAATPLVYVVIMCLMLLFAVGMVNMARHMEKPGAFYTYITAGLGRIPGLGAGFLALTSYLLTTAGVYVVGGVYANVLIHDTLGGPSASWWVWAAVLWCVVSGLSMLNIDVSTRVLGVCLLTEVLIVALYDLNVFSRGGAHGLGLDVTANLGTGSWGFALLWGVACLTGFESIQVFRSETRDPDRTIPRATYLTVIVLAGFYALSSWAYLAAMGTDKAIASAADPTGSFLASLHDYTFTVAVDIANVLLTTTALAALLALQNISARYTFALASDRVLPRSLGQVHPRFRAPTRAAVAVALVALGIDVIVAISKPNEVLAYAAMTGLGTWTLLLLLVLTSASIVVFFRRNPGLEPNLFKSFVAPATALVGLAAVSYLATSNRLALVGNVKVANIAMILIVLFFLTGVAYAMWIRRNRPGIWDRLGTQTEEDFDPRLAAKTPERAPREALQLKRAPETQRLFR